MLSSHEEKIYRDACEKVKAYNKLKDDKKKIPIVEQQYRANMIIKVLGNGLKRGDKFFRQSTSQELTTLLAVIQALTEDDLIFKPVEKFDGIGG